MKLRIAVLPGDGIGPEIMKQGVAGDAILPSHPLTSPSPLAFNLSLHQGLFQ